MYAAGTRTDLWAKAFCGSDLGRGGHQGTEMIVQARCVVQQHVGEAGSYERPAAVLAAASMDARIGTGYIQLATAS